jgi:ribonuclease VapC
MNMFVDASAAVAIIADEADREALRLKLKNQRRRIASPIVAYETSLALGRLKAIAPLEALDLFSEFTKIYAIVQVSIEPRITRVAMQAFENFGKGRHKSQLNMGDCFAYACARVHRVPLLCRGNDFIHTDIELA